MVHDVTCVASECSGPTHRVPRIDVYFQLTLVAVEANLHRPLWLVLPVAVLKPWM
jgi:hypothetical protein